MRTIRITTLVEVDGVSDEDIPLVEDHLGQRVMDFMIDEVGSEDFEMRLISVDVESVHATTPPETT